MKNFILVLLLAAALEAGGDAAIRKFFQSGNNVFGILGIFSLLLYGCLVNFCNVSANSPRWLHALVIRLDLPVMDFSSLLGQYIVAFAIMAVLIGVVCFREIPSITTVLGILLVIAGGVVISLGQR